MQLEQVTHSGLRPDEVLVRVVATGIIPVIRSAVDALRQRGTCGIVGASKPGEELKLDAIDFMQSCKRLRGIVEGDAVADVFIPRLVDLYMQGRFPFDKLVKFYSFEDINKAAEDSAKGGTIKPVIQHWGINNAGGATRQLRLPCSTRVAETSNRSATTTSANTAADTGKHNPIKSTIPSTTLLVMGLASGACRPPS